MHVVTILSLVTCVVANFEDDIFADAGNDPKDNYFRYVRTYTQADYKDDGLPTSRALASDEANIPKPYGFRIYYSPNARQGTLRVRRDDADADGRSEAVESTLLVDGDDLANIDDESKPLELDVLDAAAEKENSTESTIANDLVINDFIRFKREALEKASQADDNADSVRAKRQPEGPRSGKMLLNDGEPLPEGSREPRGVVREQWLKQPYPVLPSHAGGNDNYDSLSQQPAAPRVHFVTQRRSESSPPLVYHSYEREREGRSNRQHDIDLGRDLEPAYYPRPARHYNSPPLELNFSPQQQQFYREPRERERDRNRDRDFDRDNRDNREMDRSRTRVPQYYAQQDRFYDDDRAIAAQSGGKQRRIIYYATLPEIVRSPASMMDTERERKRFNYRDDRDNRFTPEDRYSPQPISAAINYRFREDSYDNAAKTRYDEASAKNAAYPTKVASPDVSVRALKKNPERRIFTEVERRYPYKANYHQQDHQDEPSFERNHR